jgi:Putative peptidoglycan binding domain
MPNYTYLALGDRLPTVGVAQKLLKAYGYVIDTDGVFGRDTREAVQHFQNEKNITPSGVIGGVTWNRLIANIRLPILDCIDVTDVDVYEAEYSDIVSNHSLPIIIGGSSDGTRGALSIIRGRIVTDTFLLRFHGHGAAGVAGVSDGHGDDIVGREHTYFDVREVRRLRDTFEHIGSSLSRYGSVQFMHCSTGSGRDGRYFLETLAEIMQVPVTGAVHDQQGGGVNTFRFEGATYTAIANGRNLRLWCNALPDFMPLA